MKERLLNSLLVGGLVGLIGCSGEQSATAGGNKVAQMEQTATPVRRWYSLEQVERGNPLFQTNCASCHQPDASGTPNWRETDANGKYPPPPLNGTAHTWHHPLSILRRTVKVGGVPLGGTMPGFADKLNDQDIDDILAWVQSHWPERIYRIWQERDAQAGNRLQPPGKG